MYFQGSRVCGAVPWVLLSVALFYLLLPSVPRLDDARTTSSSLNESTEPNLKTWKTSNAKKIILFYPKPAYLDYHTYTRACDYKCSIVYDKDTYFNSSDAIVWAWNYGVEKLIPQTKPMGQVWALLTNDPPISGTRLATFERLFNYTMTMRRDCDLPIEKTKFRSTANTRAYVNRSEIMRKSKQAAWFVSHCNTQSKRELYVNQLQKYISVDIFGACGPFDCPKLSSKCADMLHSTYEFYLSFENSFCKDYLTEKIFWKMSEMIVPVVRGGADYDLYLPRGSYINSNDFPDAKYLAEYLLYLGSNFTAYYQYYKARQGYMYKSCATVRPFCELCKRLHNPESHRRLYGSVSQWMTGPNGNLIYKPRDLIAS